MAKKPKAPPLHPVAQVAADLAEACRVQAVTGFAYVAFRADGMVSIGAPGLNPIEAAAAVGYLIPYVTNEQNRRDEAARQAVAAQAADPGETKH